MGPRRTHTAMGASQDLANANRNARQKTLLLCEVNLIRRSEAQAAVDEGKRIVAQSKKLCQKSAPAKRSKAV